MIALAVILSLLGYCDNEDISRPSPEDSSLPEVSESICSASSLGKIASASSGEYFAFACTDGIVLSNIKGESKLMAYPALEETTPCEPEIQEGQTNTDCQVRNLKAKKSHFAASYGKRHLLYFSVQAPSLSVLTLERAIRPCFYSQRKISDRFRS